MFDANLLLSGRQFWRRQSWKNPRLEYMEIYISAASVILRVEIEFPMG